MDLERIANAVREILLAVGEDPEREALMKTPTRAAAEQHERAVRFVKRRE